MTRILVAIGIALCAICAEAQAARTPGKAQEFAFSFPHANITGRAVEKIRVRMEAAKKLLEHSTWLLNEKATRFYSSGSARAQLGYQIALKKYLNAVVIIEEIAVELSALSAVFPELAFEAQYWKSLAENLNRWIRSQGLQRYTIGQ